MSEPAVTLRLWWKFLWWVQGGLCFAFLCKQHRRERNENAFSTESAQENSEFCISVMDKNCAASEKIKMRRTHLSD